MRRWKQQLSTILLAGLLPVVLAPHASATTTYMVSGATYNPASLLGVYASATAITGSSTTASPLPKNLTNAPIAGGTGGLGLVTSWSFSYGVFTYTNANSGVLREDGQSFMVSTDGERRHYNLPDRPDNTRYRCRGRSTCRVSVLGLRP